MISERETTARCKDKFEMKISKWGCKDYTLTPQYRGEGHLSPGGGEGYVIVQWLSCQQEGRSRARPLCRTGGREIQGSKGVTVEIYKLQQVAKTQIDFSAIAVLEFQNNLWGLRTKQEQGCRTGPPGYILVAWRNHSWESIPGPFKSLPPGTLYSKLRSNPKRKYQQCKGIFSAESRLFETKKNGYSGRFSVHTQNSAPGHLKCLYL